MSREEIVSCDICKSKEEIKKDTQIQVIFTTEQTEGRCIAKSYLDHKNIDICKTCMDRILKGEAVFAEGAQGYNKYYFKEVSNGKEI